MKLLQNPFVVGALGVVAVAVVANQFMGSKPGGRPAAKPASGTKSASAKPGKAPGKPPDAKSAAASKGSTNVLAILPERPVEALLIGKRFKSWVDSPPRDPFLILKPVVEDSATTLVSTNSPVPTWRLSATWHQTDSRLAVINDKVYRVGDVVDEGYKLIRIDEQEVWFQGPHRNERLTFPEPKNKTLPQKGAAKAAAKTVRKT